MDPVVGRNPFDQTQPYLSHFSAVASHVPAPSPTCWLFTGQKNKITSCKKCLRKTLKVEFFGEFESIFETSLDHESEDQLGSFGEITLDKIISSYSPFKTPQDNLDVSHMPNVTMVLTRDLG